MSGLLLAIDVGNSQIEVGLARGDCWCSRWRLETKIGRTADEYGVLIGDLVSLEGDVAADIEHVVLSSVVPGLTPVMTRMSQQVCGVVPLIVSPGVRTGMPVAYSPAAALGSDRLVDAVAARARVGAPVVVVDFGTATTFNVVDAQGTFIGGAIAPGLGVAAAALSRSGARLRRFDLSAPTNMPVIGRDTAQSMRSGVLYGYAGLVSGLLTRIDEELWQGSRCRAPVIATGGMCRNISHLVHRIDEVVPGLTLDGLRLIHELNA
jgi:type III pantothenate kinase